MDRARDRNQLKEQVETLRRLATLASVPVALELTLEAQRLAREIKRMGKNRRAEQ